MKTYSKDEVLGMADAFDVHGYEEVHGMLESFAYLIVRNESITDEVLLALGYSRNFAAANPRLSNMTREHINGLCDLLEKYAQPLVEHDPSV